MPRRIYFWAYNNGSGSVNQLCERLDARAIKHARSNYRPRPTDLRIGWGFARPIGLPILNRAESVALAISKRRTFQTLTEAGVPTVVWTNQQEVANEWNSRGRILGRDKDHGSQGEGITVYNKGSQVGRHAFYCKYFRKRREFRLHVWQGRVIFVQEKLRKEGFKEDTKYDAYVRSHHRGWIFAFNHLGANPCPQGIAEVAVAAVRALRLDFGAVDIGWNEKEGPCVFEINTAPGIEESSLDAYVEAIRATI